MYVVAKVLQNALTRVLVTACMNTNTYIETHMHIHKDTHARRHMRNTNIYNRMHTQEIASTPVIWISSLLRSVLVARGYELLSTPTHWACASLLLPSPIPYAAFLCPDTSASQVSLAHQDLMAWAHAIGLFIPSLGILYHLSASWPNQNQLTDTPPASVRIVAAVLTASMGVDITAMIYPCPIRAAPYRAAAIAYMINTYCLGRHDFRGQYVFRFPIFAIATILTHSSELLWVPTVLATLYLPHTTTRPLLPLCLLGLRPSTTIHIKTILLLVAFVDTVAVQIPPLHNALVALDGAVLRSCSTCWGFYAVGPRICACVRWTKASLNSCIRAVKRCASSVGNHFVWRSLRRLVHRLVQSIWQAISAVLKVRVSCFDQSTTSVSPCVDIRVPVSQP